MGDYETIPPMYKKFILEVDKIRDEIAQACAHTQGHMKNAWSEMVSWSPCFAFYCFLFISLVHTNNMKSFLSLSDKCYGLILTLMSLMPLSLHL